MLDGVLSIMPSSRVGFLGMFRDEKTATPQSYYENIPDIPENGLHLIIDPMLATGNSSSAAIDLIKERGVKVKNIKLVSLLAAPEGIKNLRKNHKDLHIFTCSLEKGLNKKKYIVPGLGDAGDRYMGT